MTGIELMTMVIDETSVGAKQKLMKLTDEEINDIHKIYLNKKGNPTKEQMVDQVIRIVLNTLNIGYVFTASGRRYE